MSDASGHYVHSGDGRRLRLGPMLKSGGAGSIHRLPESPHQVAKIYHRHVDLSDYEHKVEAMLALSPELPDIVDGAQRYVQIAWPQSTLRDPRGRFVGFLMPTVDVKATSELETILQERQARAAGLPTGLGAKITLAANLAAVVGELHRRGHHVVDLKPVNLRFYPKSLYMAMLDCDGFSIRGQDKRFTAPQFTPDYLAPEFQRGGLTDEGEESQDRFALAVVVFQLLNFGIHPFTGRPANDRVPTDIPGRIAAGCYAYGERANASLAPSPVSCHATLPHDLRQLFDRAFVQRGDLRPAAAEWATLLRHFAQRSSLRLVSCGRNAQHQHFAGSSCAACTREALIAQTAQRAAGARLAAPAAAATTPWMPGSRRPAPGQPAAPKTPLRPRWTTRTPTPARPTQVPPNRWTPTAGTPPGAPPPPNWPSRRHRSSSVSNMPDWLKDILLRVFGIAIALVLVRACDNRGSYTSPPPSRPAQTRVAEPPPTPAGSATKPHPAYVVDRARTMMDSVAMSLLRNSTTARINALRSLGALSGNAQAPMTRQVQAPRPALLALLEAQDPAALQARIAELTEIVGKNPRAAESGFELGWLHLLAGNALMAQDAFVRAVLADPTHPAAWYGYGVAVGDPGLTVGSLANAELLSADEASAQNVRVLFPDELRRATRDDPERFRRMVARGRLIAATYDGRTLDAETAALAREPLPAR